MLHRTEVQGKKSNGPKGGLDETHLEVPGRVNDSCRKQKTEKEHSEVYKSPGTRVKDTKDSFWK